MKNFFPYILCALFLTGCKTTKTGVSSAEDLATAKVIKASYATHFDFETLASRLKVRYKGPDKSQNVTLNLRMEKDKTIWLSGSLLGITLAKAKITPNRVQYYESIGGTYFDGDFALLSEFLGTSLNFEQVQSLLLGEPIYDLRNGQYLATAEGAKYKIEPKKQQALFDLFFFIKAGEFTLEQQRIKQDQENRELMVLYGDFTAYEQGLLPNTISLKAREASEITEIDIEYRNVDINVNVSFPFSIPDGYEEIKL